MGNRNKHKVSLKLWHYMNERGPDFFCGVTLLQFHPSLPGEVLFAHRNHDKWSMSGAEGKRRWKAIKQGRFTNNVKPPADLTDGPASWNWGVLLSVPELSPAKRASDDCKCGIGF